MRSHRPSSRPLARALALLVGPLFFVACSDTAQRPPTSSDSSQRGLVVLDDGVAAPDGVPDRPDFHSFGEVPDGTMATHTFRMRNVELEPVAIRGIKPGCGCTAAGVRARTSDGEVLEGAEPEEAGEPWLVVPPGAEVELTLAVDTRDIATKNRDRTLTTRLTTDSELGRYRTFEVHLYVAQDLQISPRTLRLTEVARSVGGSGVIDIVPVGDERLEVGAVLSAPDDVRVEVVPTDVLGHRAWKVQASLDPPLELGARVGTIEIGTLRADGSDGHVLAIPFLADVVPDLAVEPRRLVLVGRGDEELFAEVRVRSLQPGERLLITSSELAGEGRDQVALEVQPDDPDGRGRSHSWTLRLRPGSDGWPAEVLRGHVLVTLDRATESELRVPWVAHPR